MNRWKLACFVALGGWLTSVAVAAYFLVDEAVTIGYLKDGYADCGAHRDFLHTLLEHRLTRTEARAAGRNVKWSANGSERTVAPAEFKLSFDANGAYVGSQFGASSVGQP
jgi:hypothetical protein